MAEKKNNQSKGKRLFTALLCMGMIGAAGVGMLAAKINSGINIFDMTRPSASDYTDNTDYTDPTTQEEEQRQKSTERYSGIDNDRTYFRDENGTYIPEYDTVQENTLDPSLFYTADGRTYYNSESARYGIDISSHQEKVDWEAVKAAGMDFVILRAGYRGYGEAGTLNPDDMFLENAEGALAAGLEVGAYIFSQAITEQEAIDEANLILDMTKDLKITYPIVFDWEEIDFDDARTDNVTSDEMTRFAKAFCDTVVKAGHVAAVYLNVDQGYMLYDLEVLDDYELWIASYKEKPDFYYDFDMWQYTSKGSVDGVNGSADMNISFKDYSMSGTTED